MKKPTQTKTKEIGAFIDTIQEWFLPRSKFWGMISILTFFSLLILQIFISVSAGTNPKARQEIDFLVISFLALFVFSMFWRGFMPSFMSIGGALSTYYGIVFINVQFVGLKTLPSFIANRLGYGIVSSNGPSVQSLGELYFIGGMLCLVLCMVITFKPSFFRSKGNENLLP